MPQRLVLVGLLAVTLVVSYMLFQNDSLTPTKIKEITDSTQEKRKGETIETASGLKYRVLKSGEGASPRLENQVRVHYRGRLENGKEFDSSYQRGQPAIFPVNGLIKGWTEALLLMRPGAKWELHVPAELGYGSRGVGDTIPPNSLLIFEVELLEVL